jgi:DNA-binding CsgD family transcriptional regulator
MHRMASPSRACRPPKSTPLARLTPRELDVLREMAQGRGNAGIAQQLFLSESSVEKHVNGRWLRRRPGGQAPNSPVHVAADIHGRIAGLRPVQVGSSAVARLSDSHRLKSAVLQLR